MRKFTLMLILCLGIIETYADGTIRRIHVPILMYHYISPLPPDADSIREGLTLDPELFAQQMQYLKNEGYTTISLYEMNQALENGYELPSKPIILTFDDSYTDHYDYVFPILREHNFTGTFFVITQFTDASNPNHLTWEQVEEMSNAGMNMESHTKTHSTLIERSYDFLVWEVIGSIESIESHTGIRPEIFSYPVGKYDETTLTFLETTTIIHAVTTEHGAYHTLHNAILSPRLRVSANMGVAGLRNLLSSAP